MAILDKALMSLLVVASSRGYVVCWLTILLSGIGQITAETVEPAFRDRGYYLLLMRTPTFGLEAWKDILDCVTEDGGNVVVLWVGGAFRSAKFPVTWEYNRDHQNVRADFVRPLIRHAHERGLAVLLGLTPFGYDGVNQYPKEHPETKAIGSDGKPVGLFGIDCWGWNLCPAPPESQRFMLEYTRELAFEFYPEADGLFLESSDYAICHHCGAKHFEREYAYVRQISDEYWARHPHGRVVVYPHYFTGAKMPFANEYGAKMPFDPRWTVFFTPHSAHFEPGLIAQSKGGSWFWNEGPALLDLERIRQGVRQAREAHCTGYVPTLECMTYVPTHPEDGQPWLVGRRQIPFGFGWVKGGRSPYRELPLRVVRLACREYWKNPDLPPEDFKRLLGREIFGGGDASVAVEDALSLVRVFGTERNWSTPAPLTSPGLVRARAEQGRLQPEQQAAYRASLEEVRRITERYRGATNGGACELHRIASWLVRQWEGENAALLAPRREAK